MRDPEGPNEGFPVDGVPVHKLDMTAGAAAMIARRAEREAEIGGTESTSRAKIGSGYGIPAGVMVALKRSPPQLPPCCQVPGE